MLTVPGVEYRSAEIDSKEEPTWDSSRGLFVD